MTAATPRDPDRDTSRDPARDTDDPAARQIEGARIAEADVDNPRGSTPGASTGGDSARPGDPDAGAGTAGRVGPGPSAGQNLRRDRNDPRNDDPEAAAGDGRA